MKRTLILRQKSATGVRVLGKPSVKGHDLQLVGHGEGGQVRIAPDMRRIGLACRETSPVGFKIHGLVAERNARIAPEDIVVLPGFAQRQGTQPNTFLLVANRKKPCCVIRQKRQISSVNTSNQFFAAG